MTDGEDDLVLSPPWKQAAAELFGAKYKHGDVVPHEELQAALGLAKPVGRIEVEEYERWRLNLLAQMDALSTFLLEERNMDLRAVPGRGYLIVEPKRQTDLAVSDGMKRVKSELRKMGRRLSFVDRTALSSEEARANADALARLAFLSQQAGKAQRLKFTASPGDEKD